MARHVRVTGANEAAKSLRSVEGRMFRGGVGPVSQGMRKGASVIVKAWREQIKQSTRTKADAAANAKYPYIKTGLMAKAVGLYRMKRPGRVNAKLAYRVTVNTSAVYPRTGDKTGREPYRIAAVAGILEHGRSDMPALGIVRKAFAKSNGQASSAIAAQITQDLTKILNKL